MEANTQHIGRSIKEGSYIYSKYYDRVVKIEKIGVDTIIARCGQGIAVHIARWTNDYEFVGPVGKIREDIPLEKLKGKNHGLRPGDYIDCTAEIATETETGERFPVYANARKKIFFALTDWEKI
jgi:hypothetical protein